MISCKHDDARKSNMTYHRRVLKNTFPSLQRTSHGKWLEYFEIGFIKLIRDIKYYEKISFKMASWYRGDTAQREIE